MKRFQFRLARVQRAREISERLARSDWLTAESESIRAERASDDLRVNIANARAELTELQRSDDFSPGAVLSADRALERSWNALAAKRRVASERRSVAEDSRQTWTDRERDRQALERLEDRQKELHRIEMVRIEDAETDEWASSRRSLKNKPSSDGSPTTD
ncbi:MAG: flagellar export protein FliJ [Planctomycetota bacterium]|jgi:flagellar export protein FliJ